MMITGGSRKGGLFNGYGVSDLQDKKSSGSIAWQCEYTLVNSTYLKMFKKVKFTFKTTTYF